MAFTFIPEDGNGLANANSFFPLATIETEIENYPTELASFWAAITGPSATVTKQKILVAATKILTMRYRFYGKTFNPGQALQWPRTINYDDQGRVIDAGTMPYQLIKAMTALSLMIAEDPTLMEPETAARVGDAQSWSTEGLAINFGKGDTNESDLQKNQIFASRFVEIDLLLRSIGEVWKADMITTNMKSLVR